MLLIEVERFGTNRFPYGGITIVASVFPAGETLQSDVIGYSALQTNPGC